MPGGRAQRQARGGVVLPRQRAEHGAGRLLGDEIGRGYARRHRSGRRRSAHRRARREVDPAVAGHAVRGRHRAQPAEHGLGARVEPAHRLPGTARRARPHGLRDRPRAGCSAGRRLGLQQLGRADARPRAGESDRRGRLDLRRAAPVRASGHDAHLARHRPRRQAAAVRGNAVDLPGPRAIRPADARSGPLGGEADRLVRLGGEGDRLGVDQVERRLRLSLVAEPRGRHPRDHGGDPSAGRPRARGRAGSYPARRPRCTGRSDSAIS